MSTLPEALREISTIRLHKNELGEIFVKNWFDHAKIDDIEERRWIDIPEFIKVRIDRTLGSELLRVINDRETRIFSEIRKAIWQLYKNTKEGTNVDETLDTLQRTVDEIEKDLVYE